MKNHEKRKLMKIGSSRKAFWRAPSTLDGKSMIVYINLGLGSWHWRPGSWEAGWALGAQVAGTGGWPWRWAPAGRPQGISWRPHWEFAWKLRKALPNSQSGTPGNFLESPLGISVGTLGNCLESALAHQFRRARHLCALASQRKWSRLTKRPRPRSGFLRLQ